MSTIGRGMAQQRDYSGACQLRACVRARLGRLGEALADQREAARALDGALRRLLGGTDPPASAQPPARRGRAVAA